MEILLMIPFLIAVILLFIVWDQFSNQPIGGQAIFGKKLLQTIIGCTLIGIFSYFLLLINNKAYLTHYDNLPVFLGGMLACLVLIGVAIIGGVLIYIKSGKYDSDFRADILDC